MLPAPSETLWTPSNMMPNLDMTIERLELTNFKTFPHAVIPFARRMNVFVGINGAGKTSILLALSKLLSWQARRMSSPVGSGGGSAILEQEIRSGAPDAMLKAVARWGDRTFSWTLAKTRRGGRIAVSRSDLLEMTNAVRDFRNRFPEGDFGSPLFASYSANRMILDIPKRIRVRHSFGPENANNGALTGVPDFRLFVEWFREREDILNERIVEDVRGRRSKPTPQDPELKWVKEALSRFLPDVSDWRVRRGPMRFLARKKEGEFVVDQLSDGEKNLLAVVGDIARRLVQANRGSTSPLDGPGVVLIDEIELHLHPAWQTRILPQLFKTFPRVQFAVTTHSSFVLSQLNSLLLERGMAGTGASGAGARDIDVFAVRNGNVDSLLSEDTGLIKSSEMDDVAAEIDEEFDRLLEKSGS